MAYNRKFNPDALPAHAEPEEAAQRLSATHALRRPASQASQVSSTPPPVAGGRHPSPISYQQKPAPPLPAASPSNYSTASVNSYDQAQFSRLQSPPPPQNYGHGPRPINPAASRSTAPNLPPRTPQPPEADSPELLPLFRSANKSQNGLLSEGELSSALVNADYTAFDTHTIRVMMQMFDTSGKGAINYDEFIALWRFLAAWRKLFEQFDEDRSGRVSQDEFSKALTAFGYRLSPKFVANLYNTFTRNRKSGGGGMSFDLFVQACVSLKRLTDTFKVYDDDRDGYITLSFEEFLFECLKLREYLVQ